MSCRRFPLPAVIEMTRPGCPGPSDQIGDILAKTAAFLLPLSMSAPFTRLAQHLAIRAASAVRALPPIGWAAAHVATEL